MVRVLWLLSKARQRSDSGSVLYRKNSTCHLHDVKSQKGVSVFIINDFVYCSIFVY